MLRIIGIVVTVLGAIAALVGAIWGSLPHPDANIGAGLLIVLGLPVAGLGLLLLVLGFVLARRARS